jgi:hypothetical protein
MLRWTIVTLALLMSFGVLLRAEPAATRPERSSPAEAKTTEEIVKAVEPFKGFGGIQTAEFNRWGCRVFAIWYCPFSGRGSCYLHTYYYDYDKEQWVRFIDQLVPSGGDLSAEMPPGQEVIFRSSDGKIAIRESVAKFPVKKK